MFSMFFLFFKMNVIAHPGRGRGNLPVTECSEKELANRAFALAYKRNTLLISDKLAAKESRIGRKQLAARF
jgi:hypothetical protein